MKSSSLGAEARPTVSIDVRRNPCVGLGLRRDIINEFTNNDLDISFVELAPENWIDVGGRWGKALCAISERYPITTHGLSLSLGSPEPIDWDYLAKIKKFLERHQVSIYSEHLSYSKCDNAHLYDLLPIPFCEEAVRHVSKRISEVQDFLGMQIAIENVSYYTTVAPELTEAEFIKAIVNEAGCKLLLDVNNVFVNAFNHQYDPEAFIEALPLEAVGYIHMAGHEQKSADLIIDTHGEAVIDPVFDLFSYTMKRMNPVPVLLERDFNFPEMEELLGEVDRIRSIIRREVSLKPENYPSVKSDLIQGASA